MNTSRLLRFAIQTMMAAIVITAAFTASRVQAASPATPPKPLAFVELQAKANQKLTDALHGFDGNNLDELPKGESLFQGIKFKIGDSYIRLGGRLEPKVPLKVEGIPIGKTLTKFYILHGTGFGAFGDPGDEMFIQDGAEVGEYHVRYEDGTEESIPIVYGEDVRDWWNWEKPAAVKRGQIAWTGKNAFSRKEKTEIHLYLTTWSNPHPEKKILGLDYICNGKTAASPFCVAISFQEK